MGRFNALELADIPEPPSGGPKDAGKPCYAGEPVKDAQYFLDRGDRLFFRSVYERALEEYSRAVGLDPGSAPAWQGQVFSLIEVGEYHEAGLWYANAAGVVGETPDLLALRALAAARTGEFDRACGYSDSSLEKGGGALAYIVRGELFLYSRRNAGYCFEQAFAVGGIEEWKAAVLVADCCLFADTDASAGMAMKFLSPVLSRHPEKGELQLRMARTRLRLGDRRGAEMALAACSTLMPDYTIPDELKKAVAARGFWARLFGR